MAKKTCIERLLGLYGWPNAYGALSRCARDLGVSAAVVSSWRVAGYIPPRRAVAVELATGGKVPALDVLVENETLAPRKGKAVGAPV